MITDRDVEMDASTKFILAKAGARHDKGGVFRFVISFGAILGGETQFLQDQSSGQEWRDPSFTAEQCSSQSS